MTRPQASQVGSERAYGIFGARLTSSFDFTTTLATAIEPEAPRLRFDVVTEPPIGPGWDATPPAYAEPTFAGEDEVAGSVVALPDLSVLRFSGAADFFVSRDRITCHLRNSDYRFAIEIWLLGTVLAYWLEQRGLPTLHASSVEVADHCVAFLSTNKGGKSTLAAGFLSTGARLMGDDLLPLRATARTVEGLAGYPQMRMWPDQARNFVPDASLERVQPAVSKLRVPIERVGLGLHCPHARPLAALYLPERIVGEAAPPDVEISALSAGDALKALLRHSFLNRVVEAVGLAPARLAGLGEVVRQVPVRRLRYPSGMERLPRVVEAVTRDLRTLS